MHDQYTQIPLILDTKQCTKCGETKPFSGYYFRKKDNRYESACKACHRAENRAWREAHPGRSAETARKWREEHPERFREMRAKWKVDHAKETQERSRILYATNSKMREWRRQYSLQHRDEIAVKNKMYRARDPDAIRAARWRRKMRLRGVSGNVTPAEWRERIAYFNGHCAYCGEQMIRPTQDHMVPISRGGAHSIENLVPACMSCNSRKGTKNLLEYLIYERG
jgi:5-methylcytosine-specific restriction endonuclease McrA